MFNTRSKIKFEEYTLRNYLKFINDLYSCRILSQMILESMFIYRSSLNARLMFLHAKVISTIEFSQAELIFSHLLTVRISPLDGDVYDDREYAIPLNQLAQKIPSLLDLELKPSSSGNL